MGADQTEPEEAPADAVGRRVLCGGERATVRYVGPVPPTAGKTEVSHTHLYDGDYSTLSRCLFVC